MNDTDALVETYLTIRRKRETLKADYESADSELKEDMTRLEQALLAICNETNVNGLKTTHGTVTRTVKDRFFCTDWDHFKKFVELEGSIDLLERRIHQRNFKEFMANRESKGLPPGVNALREYDITVRKASTTSETSV
jgi:hypothetical protein